MTHPPDIARRRTRHTPLTGVRARLESYSASLPPTSRRIARFILDHAEDVVHMSVTEVAENTRASEGAVIKLCKQIGATGFQQLKIALAQDLVQPTELMHEDLQRGDDVATVMQKIFHSGVNATQLLFPLIHHTLLHREGDVLHHPDVLERVAVPAVSGCPAAG